jgi:hypothetical protein
MEAPMADPVILAEIGKNSREAVRIALDEYRGSKLIDIRTVCQWGDVDAFRPTRKGVSLKLEHLPALIEALQRAEAEAVRLGILAKQAA